MDEREDAEAALVVTNVVAEAEEPLLRGADALEMAREVFAKNLVILTEMGNEVAAKETELAPEMRQETLQAAGGESVSTLTQNAQVAPNLLLSLLIWM